MTDCILLGSQDAGTTHSLDLFLGDSTEEPRLDDNWLLGQNTFSQNLEVTGPGDINNWSLVLHSSIFGSSLLRHKSPQFVQIDPVVMLATSVTTTSRMLPVLSNPSVSMRNVTSQLPGLPLTGGHPDLSCRSESSNKSL